MLVTRNDYPGNTLMEPEYYQYLLLMLLAIAKNRPENLLLSLPELSSKFLSEKKARVEREREEEEGEKGGGKEGEEEGARGEESVERGRKRLKESWWCRQVENWRLQTRWKA